MSTEGYKINLSARVNPMAYILLRAARHVPWLVRWIGLERLGAIIVRLFIRARVEKAST